VGRRLVVLAGSVVVALPSVAVAASPPKVIRLTAVTSLVRKHDVAPKGPSAGDTVLDQDRVLNAAPQFGKPAGAVVGSDTGTFTYASDRVTFAGSVTLPGGKLVIHGTVVFHGTTSYVLPVTAGTGAFKGAHGTLTVSGGSAKRALNVYRLSY
jgi:hypothetical protein